MINKRTGAWKITKVIRLTIIKYGLSKKGEKKKIASHKCTQEAKNVIVTFFILFFFCRSIPFSNSCILVFCANHHCKSFAIIYFLPLAVFWDDGDTTINVNIRSFSLLVLTLPLFSSRKTVHNPHVREDHYCVQCIPIFSIFSIFLLSDA